MITGRSLERFLVFEGIDGSGQDTQAVQLVKWLREQGLEVWHTAEPSLSVAGKNARSVLQGIRAASPSELQRLFTEDRTSHVCELMGHYDRGEVIVCVRYLYSTLAYGKSDGLSEKELDELRRRNSCFPRPYKAFYLDLSPEEAIRRIQLRGAPVERFEKKAQLERVREAFLELTEQNDELVRIDASGSIEEVHQRIKECLAGCFAGAG